MRYARPSCEECTKLAAETEAHFQTYLDAKDALALTSKRDAAHHERQQHLDTVIGKLKEARRREDAHESTHQDEFSN